MSNPPHKTEFINAAAQRSSITISPPVAWRVHESLAPRPVTVSGRQWRHPSSSEKTSVFYLIHPLLKAVESSVGCQFVQPFLLLICHAVICEHLGDATAIHFRPHFGIDSIVHNVRYARALRCQRSSSSSWVNCRSTRQKAINSLYITSICLRQVMCRSVLYFALSLPIVSVVLRTRPPPQTRCSVPQRRLFGMAIEQTRVAGQPA